MKTNIKKSGIAIIQNIKKSYVIKHKKSLVCEWGDLKGKIILNKNIVIRGFGLDAYFLNSDNIKDVDMKFLGKKYLNYTLMSNGYGKVLTHNPPIFKNAKKVYLLDNHDFIHYYLRHKFFPSLPDVFLVGSPDGSYEPHLVSYERYSRYPKSSMYKISEEEYNDVIDGHIIENIRLVNNHRNDINLSEFVPNYGHD